MIILIIVAIAAIVFSFNIFSLPFARGVPYVPAKNKNLKNIFKKFEWNKDSKIVDLGCGDGRVLRVFERLGYKNLYGYEINLWPYLICKIKNFFQRSEIKVQLKNFEKVDLGQFDVVFCYLLNSYLRKLKSKFEEELKPGARLISYGFEIPGWTPTQTIDTTSKKITGKLYIYER